MDSIEEIRYITEHLRPVAFFARIDLWRKGGVTGTNYESRVSGTRTPMQPAFDVTDQRLNEAEALYREHLVDASVAKRTGDERGWLRSLRKAQRLEDLWLKPIVTPDKEMAKELGRLASDAQACSSCDDTKEAFVRRLKKKGYRSPIWRLKVSPDGKSDCPNCYMTKYRARQVEEAEAS